MKVTLMGATGMVGQGALRECLGNPAVESVLTLGRSITGTKHPKLLELAHADLFDLGPISDQLAGYDACFFCLGTGSTGMSEDDYRRINYELPLSVATSLIQQNRAMTFAYISGAGAGENKRTMWARVKGRTEKELLALPFKGAYMLRIGYVQPGRGIKSRSMGTRVMYALLAPVYPLLKLIFRESVTSTEEVGKAMIAVAQQGYEQSLMSNRDINKAARRLA